MRTPAPLLCLAFALPLTGCDCNGGDPAVCNEPRSICAPTEVNAIDVYSDQGCKRSIGNVYCGVESQALAECLQAAAVCLQGGTTRDAVQAALAASVCAAEFAEWDGCFANGEGGGGGGGDDDD
jgi:hypothetical protein